MSSHFNYEINEVKLRERLNKMELPLSENSWQGFQDFARAHPLNQKRTVIPSFQFNLNRNLILPFVFGTVIVAFSLLLFNFVSIKKKPDVKITAHTPKMPERIPKSPVKQISAAPVIKDTTAVKTDKIAETIKQPEAIPVSALNTVVNTNTVSAGSSEADYTSIVSGNIFISPDRTTDIVGSFSAGKGFKVLEETVYFIKVNSGNTTGYIMKSQLKKTGHSSHSASRKKPKKAEVLQSNQTPFMTSEETEPKLR